MVEFYFYSDRHLTHYQYKKGSKDKSYFRAKNVNLFTIGHSNRTIEDFIHILQNYDINILFDIRRFPSSKRHPQFNQDFLHNGLQNSGLEYCFLGNELGGFRKAGYPEHQKTELFQKGINQLIYLTNRHSGCLMCAESNYLDCHRKLVSDFLTQKGISITHIIDENRTIVHSIALL